MTVGIGALCDGGDFGVIASDMRTSFPRSNVRPHDETGKTWDFDVPFPLIAAVAGNLGDCATTVTELHRLIREWARNGEVWTEHIEDAIRKARHKAWARRVDWNIRMSYCISLRDWLTGKVPGGKIDKFIHDAVRSLIDAQPLPVQLLLVGYTQAGRILFYKASLKNMLEPGIAPGTIVIGSGGQLAMDHLNKRGQSIEHGLPRTLLHVYEAMLEAKKVPDGSVGDPQAFTIVTRQGIWRIRSKAPLFREWLEAYKNRESTTSLDTSQLANEQIKALMQAHVIKRVDA